MRRNHWAYLWAGTALFAAGLPVSAPAQELAADSLANLQRLSIDELANLQITSVSKLPESLREAPAAVYVITHDDIIRSGALRIPDMLRLAPNLEVFQTSPTNYIITARGLSGNSAAQNFSNKMEVFIDGRSTYNPLYSGVYWDMQNVPPADIERIEVISGPSATLWGANSVNGVINIVTRRAGDTQGGFIALDGGNFEQRGMLQYGGRLGNDVTYRVYGQAFYERGFQTQSRQYNRDGWSNPQGGFRLDWSQMDDAVTVEGDLAYAHADQNGAPAQDFREKTITANWQHTFSPTSTLQLLAYADENQRYSVGHNGAFTVTNYDFEVQHSFEFLRWNRLLWGLGDRVSPYDITARLAAANSLIFQPASHTANLFYVFLQDNISLAQDLNLILGLKLEDDPWSGWSPLPNVRLAWTPNPNLLIWAAISRAVRAPTPFDVDVVEKSGSSVFLTGNPDFATEKLTAFELGDRAQFGMASVSVSGFYNLYSDLRSIEFSPGNALPLYWGNLLKGSIYGMEAWGNYQIMPWWRLDAGLTLQHEDLGFAAGSSQLLGVAQLGDDPHSQARLRSTMDFGPLTFDAGFRYVGMLPSPAVPAYVEMDSRIAWQITPMTQIAISGFNLLHSHHQEWTIPPADEIPRMVFVELRQSF